MTENAARPLPVAKRGLLLGRTIAFLKLRTTGPEVSDFDVDVAINVALEGLQQRARAR